MAGFAHANSRRMYSWWWDSHISPKNSKWLQENLTDMDAKVKSMIKLIEEDADSFARRAEMYYKKRPELMKLVEEFYRAYRALAERYDHATGVIRHAHRTMAEAFPNQAPPTLDDAPTIFASGAENQTADMSTPARAFFDLDEQQNELLGSDDSKKDDAKFNDGKVRKSLKFHESVVKERSVSGNDNHTHQKQPLSNSDSDQPVKESEEILILKKALAELEAEKEAGLIQYQQSLEKLSMLESEISRIQEDSRGLAEQASQAETEAQTLKETLAKLESEKEGNLLQYRQCLKKISDLENTVSLAQKDAEELNQRASKAEVEAQSVKEELAKVAAEKDAALDQYMRSLELIPNLEYKLKCAEEDAKKLKEQAEGAENEVKELKQAISKLAGQKEAAELQYHQCLETISHLESELSMAQEEAQRLNTEIEKGITNLKGAEERCLLLERANQSLHSDLEALMLKTGIQNQELAEKQKELGRLWTCIQEERLRFVEAETAFQTLQHLHAQAQEDLRLLTSELQNKVQNLAETETQKKNLHNEVLKVKEDNKNLNELSVSSAVTIKDLKNEISSLTETKGKLEEQLELRVDQRNALQQEIYCMKEELNDLNRKHSAITEQVHAVGLDAECFGSSVRVLQDENSRLKENWERERSEKLALLRKLEILENLLEKNSMLENSLSDLNAELEAVRGKIQSLEEACKSLAEEKSSLLNEKASLHSQLQVANENLEELSEKNAALENFLCDAHDQLQVLKTKSMSLEGSCQLLANEKGRVVAEKDVLNSQLESTQMRLENLEKRYAELGELYSALEKEKESSVGKIQALQISLDVQKQEHANFVHVNELQLACMKNEVQLLQEEIKYTKGELDRELDNSIESQTEVFILRRCAQDLEDKNFSLSAKNQKLLELSVSLEGMLSNAKKENLSQKVEIMSLSDQGSTLRKGIDKLLKALNIVLDHDSEGRSEQDQIYLNHILSKLEDIKNSFCTTEEETLHQSIELSILLTMLGHLRIHSENLELEKCKIEREFGIRSEQLSASQNEALMLREMNEEMKSKVMEGEQTRVVLTTQVSDLHKRLMDLQGSYQDLQRENAEILEEKGSLTKEFLQLQENKHILEGENSIMHDEILSLDCLSTFLKNCVDERSVELRELVEDRGKLQGVNGDISQRLLATERKLEELLLLKEMELQKRVVLTTQVSDLHKRLMDLQGSYQDLQRENAEILEEKGSLTKEFLQLQENKRTLEGENSIMHAEILSLDCLSTFLKNCVDERSVELRELVEDRGKLQGVNGDISQRLLATERKLEELLLLKEMELQKRVVLTTQVSDLHKRLMDLQGSYQDLQRENAEILEEKGSLTKEFLQLQENKRTLEGENSIMHDEILSLDCLSTFLKNCVDEKFVELRELVEDRGKLQGVNGDISQRLLATERKLEELLLLKEMELQKLHQEHQQTQIRAETLHSELKVVKNEVDMWEAYASDIFIELQVSNLLCILYEEKVLELSKTCEMFRDENANKDTNVSMLRERISTLASENEDLNAKLAAYVSAITLLRMHVSSLEERTSLHGHLGVPENAEVKDDALVANHLGGNSSNHDEEVAGDPIWHLQDMQWRIQSIEKAVTLKKQLMVQENQSLHSELEAAMRQVADIKSENGLRRRNKPTSEMFEVDNGLLTKDIMLDQVSEFSPYRRGRREQIDAGSRNLESWEAGDQDGSIDLTVSKTSKMANPATDRIASFHGVKSAKKQKNEPPSAEIVVEKELGVDKLEISKRFTEPHQEGNKRKVLERLNSDVQKLTNLQITVQDLRRKVEIIEKSKKGKAIDECDILKEQLEEANTAILKLFDLNGKLMKNVEDTPVSSHSKSSSIESEDSGSVKKRGAAEQARRMSERIGRLQLEVQKIQFVLLKLDVEKDGKGKSKISEAKKRVLLRDYLYGYGVIRSNHRRKKAPFCGCVQPRTEGD